MNKHEAQKNINYYSSEINKYQSLSRGLMTRDEMIMIDKKIIALKERIKNLQLMMYA